MAQALRKTRSASTASGQARPASGLERVRLSLKAMRPHQWSKNALILLPVFLAHRYFDWSALRPSLLAFVAFSFCASAVYILNDLIDLESDRAHPEKRHRPFASGRLSATYGYCLAPVLVLASAVLSLWGISSTFTAWLAFYLAATTLYTFKLNRIPIVDILVLAGFYTLRLLAGGAAASVPVSPWLLAFSLFFFLSLAYLKRYVELVHVRQAKRLRPDRAGYAHSDAVVLLASGVACGHLSVLVFALYTHSGDVMRLYRHPLALWAAIPMLMFWMCRVWFLAHRGKIASDPVSFALRDLASLGTAVAIVACLLVARM